MGNETEKMKVMNAHAEEVARIDAMNEENERRHAIEKLAKENGFKLDMKRLDILAEESRMRHEENIKRINNKTNKTAITIAEKIGKFKFINFHIFKRSI